MSEQLPHVPATELRKEPQGPHWLKSEYKGAKAEAVRTAHAESGEKRILHQTIITVSTQELKLSEYQQFCHEKSLQERISQADIDFLKRFKQIDFAVWADTGPTEDWYGLVQDPNTCVTILAGGLASTEEEWQNHEVSFVHNWRERFETQIKPIVGDNYNSLTIAISCPGTSRSDLAEYSNATPDDVSDDVYAQLCDTITKLLHIPSHLAIGAGHSAGGEAMIRWSIAQKFPDALPVVAFNPAVWENPALRFLAIKNLNAFGNLVKNVAEQTEGIIHFTQELILRQLLSLNGGGELTEQQRAQVEMHRAQMVNPGFALKNIELSRPDNTQRGELDLKQIPYILIAEGDVLTPEAQQRRYLAAKILNEDLRSAGLLLPELLQETSGESIIADIRARTEYKVTGGHDAIFMYTDAQDTALDALEQRMKIQLLKELPAYKEIHAILSFLRDQNIPILLKYAYGSNTGISDIEGLNEAGSEVNALFSDLEKAETFGRWVAAAKIAAGWADTTQNSSSILRDSISEEELSEFFSLIINSQGNRRYLEKHGYLDSEGKLSSELKGTPVSSELIEVVTAILYAPLDDDDKPLLESNHLNSWLSTGVLDQLVTSHDLSDFKQLVQNLVFGLSNGGSSPAAKELPQLLTKMKTSPLLKYAVKSEGKVYAPLTLTVNALDLQVLQALSQQ